MKKFAAILSTRHTRARIRPACRPAEWRYTGGVFTPYMATDPVEVSVPTAAGGSNVGFKCPCCGQLVAEYLSDENGQVLPDRPVFDWAAEHGHLWL